MANYTTLRQGNSNTAENKKLQQALKDAGYGSYLGSAGVDGIYGPDTAAAVKAYQKDNKLQIDGIAGDETLGHLYSSAANAGTQVQLPATAPVAAATETSYRWDKENDPVYQAAKQKATDLEGSEPTYQGTFDEQYNQMYQEIMGQEKFEYDLNGDPLWQQYKDQHTRQGKMAMMDAMGQAAGLTGGYGSSFGQAAGQQAYQGEMQKLSDRVPELYALAMQKYDHDQAQLKDKFAVVKGMRDDEYGRYQDQRSDYYTQLGLAKDAEQTAYERGSSEWLTGEQLRRDDEKTAYTREQDAYSKIANMIATTGYVPSDAELAAAGMTREEADALAAQYNREMQLAYSSKGSSGDNGEPKYELPEYKLISEWDEEMRNAKSAVYAEGIAQKIIYAGYPEIAHELYERYWSNDGIMPGDS
ncbi:MAG: peptidoglycan-binding protein [Oscillospiraceae bacterium]|nr:peptidoglycan-binding protein [Oscillospiraceae bacterium]